MSYPKICVYAICKNESQFVDRWFESVKEADYVCVLDTGSTDDTVQKLKDKGAIVETEIISPWRFDVARNTSMRLIPEDASVFVCLDLDEIILPGWADKVRKELLDITDRFTYKYVWSHTADGGEGITFNSEKIHTKGYEWIHPVHEVLRKKDPDSRDIRQYIDIEVQHYPDDSKPRSSYLPLLEIAVKEMPEDDRNVHYLAREYFFSKRYGDAITQFENHLKLKSSLWPAERAASMRYIAKCFLANQKKQVAELWLHRAIMEDPIRREPYTDLATLKFNDADWQYTIKYAELALKIKQRPMDYLCEPQSWGAYLYDILCVAYWNSGDKKKALENAKKALELEPHNKRMQDNVILLEGF